MPKLTFHPDVSREIKASYAWYQEKAEGLGKDFMNELELGYQAIIDFPQTWPKFQKGFRRFLLSRFPFSVIYQNEGSFDLCCCCHAQQQKAGVLVKSHITQKKAMKTFPLSHDREVT